MKELAVILVSGGIDSCVAAAIANLKYELAFLHTNYGQLTQSKELDSFNKIADFYKVNKKLICDFNWLKEIGGSSLTDPRQGGDSPLSTTPQKQNIGTIKSQIPSTYVPFRNANLLGAAVSWAEVIGATKIFIGAVAQDAPQYPDTRPEFYKIFNELIRVGTKPDTKIKVIAPVIYMQKSEVIKLGAKLNAPLHLTWSCYKSSDLEVKPLACGECASCKRRLDAYEIAGLKDPINYA
ncbi:MAG: 7-cyano-7-deazaguanine synthase QueC [Candidatus Stahlbacteria bacterium]|nr:7-cyano-7-deazaguanine synthase QueC [Candidatus Stahlbacteria bacterium]